MQRTHIAVAFMSLLTGVAILTSGLPGERCEDDLPQQALSAPLGPIDEAPADAFQLIASANSAAAGPERWLDFSLGTPVPLAVRPDGLRAVVRAGCETVLYDLASGVRLHAWTDRFSLVRFSGDGGYLLTLMGTDVAVWDGETFDEVRRLSGQASKWNEPGYRSHMTTAAISDDGSQVAITNHRGSFDRDLTPGILLYDIESGSLLQTLPAPEKTEVGSVEFVPGRSRLLASYSSWSANDIGKSFHALWDTASGTLVCEFPLETVVQVSSDGRWIAGGRLVGSPYQLGQKRNVDSTELTISDTVSGKAIRTIEHSSPMRDFTFSPDSDRILAAVEIHDRSDRLTDFDGRLVEWEVRTGEVRFESDNSPKPYATVAYSPDGSRRFATTEEPNGVDDDVDHRLLGWNVTTGAGLPIRDYVFVSYNGSEDLFFYPQGDRFIDLEAPFAVRDVLTGNSVQTLPQHRVEMSEAAFSPDGERFLVGHRGISYLTACRSGQQRPLRLHGRSREFVDGGRKIFTYDIAHLFLIDVVADEVVWKLPFHGHYSRCDAAISADARHIVVSQRSDPDTPLTGRIAIIDTSRPDRPRFLERYASAVAFHPEGTRFIAASPEAIDEFEVDRGDHIRTLCRPPGRPLSVAYSSDGANVVACGVVGHLDQREPVDSRDQGWASLWDAAASRTKLLEGHAGPVTTAAFSPDGTRCATGSLDTTIRLWESATGNPLCTLRGHIGGLNRLAYSPRGDRILSVAQDGAALWNVARFATPPVEPLPLAQSFALVSSVDDIHAMFRESNMPTEVLPSPASRQDSVPTYRPADWVVVEVGEIEHGQLPDDVQHWLSRATRTEYCDALPAFDRKEASTLGTGGDEARFSGSFVIDPLERSILVRMTGNRIIMRDYETGSETGRWGTLEGGAPRNAEYSPNGRFVVMSKFPDVAVELHDPTTLAPVKQLLNYLPVLWFKFHPDEKRLLVGQQFGYSSTDLLTMWDVDSGRRLWSRCGPWAGSTVFSTDGRRFVSYGRDSFPRIATLWDADNGELLCMIVTADNSAANRPVLGSDGDSLHLGTPEGPQLWPQQPPDGNHPIQATKRNTNG